MTWVKSVRDREAGFTLVEMMVATMILGIVMLVFTSVFASVEKAIVRENNLSLSLDQARLAIQELDRELRSGNVLYDPTQENNGQASCTGCQPNYTLRVYTQSNADTRTHFVCRLWQIDSSQQLLTREWPPLDPGAAGDWRVVATGIVNRTLSEVAFALDPDPLKGSRTLDVTLAVNNDYTHHPTQTVRLQAALTGRDTSYGYPTNVCASTPAG